MIEIDVGTRSRVSEVKPDDRASPSVVIMLDTSSHVIPTMQREAAKVMDELLAQ